VCEEGSQEDSDYRRQHLDNNPDYAQFIVGSEIAVIAVEIEKARICDIKDQVSYWNYVHGFSLTEAPTSAP
jgi:hypothetical protein